MLVAACAAVVLLAGAALAGSPALAAKGGGNGGGGGHKGGGGHGGGTPAAVLTYSPSPVPVGNTFTVTGTGFAANSWVGVGFFGWIDWYYVMSDANGSFTFTYPTTMNYCDSYLFQAKQNTTVASVYVNVTGCP